MTLRSSRLLAHDLTNKKRTDDVVPKENVDFKSLMLSRRVVQGLSRAGFLRPSPVQLRAIPLAKFGLG